MKKKLIFPLLAVAALAVASCSSLRRSAGPDAATDASGRVRTDAAAAASETMDSLRVTIFGDSYSTFEGWLSCDTNEVWYSPTMKHKNDCRAVEQTWWHQVLGRMGWRLERNNSYSGSTVCFTGYRKEDYTNRSFVNRLAYLGEPDLILCCAATNDSWCGAPIGEYKYADWTRADLFTFRPAMAKLCEGLRTHYPRARVLFILNSELKPEINESVETICRHYGIELLRLHDIDKQGGHPSVAGMKAFADQVVEYFAE